MSRRKVLGVDPLSWIKSTTQGIDKKPRKEKEELGQSVSEIQLSEVPQKHKNIEVPKFRTYEVKLTLRLREDQLEFLSKLEREIMKKRSRANRKERITKNSIIRAIIEAARNLEINSTEIGDEAELIKRFRRAFSVGHKNL